MRHPRILVLIILCSLLIPAGAGSAPLTPEQSLKQNFPSLKYDSFQPSAIKGLYEVTVGLQVFYYSPEAELLLVGDISLINKEGRNLTQEKRLETIARKAKDLPLDKALKIGDGKNVVIEFSDPNCGHCRRASEFLSQKNNVTRYVFFFPLSPKSEEKIRYILCAGDRVKAYKDAYSGKLDGEKLTVCNDAKVEALLKDQLAAGNRLGIDGTPFFLVNGKPVPGADLPLLDQLLGEKK